MDEDLNLDEDFNLDEDLNLVSLKVESITISPKSKILE